ncbi:MAG: menaquinone biosynthesis protein [Helicobacteraceae bacterium]|nr:menaquinone biosynthesis protein [Helicobacteraceae bacterium]
MRFGKISYLNLLPFDVFVKQYPINSSFKLFLNHNKNYPSKLNKEFLFKRIDAGFISSIAGIKAKKAKSGIISYGEVWSVIAIPKENKLDYQSASSNALSRILKINGEILIGDRALRYKLTGGKCTDLGKIWWDKYHLPFVFGLFCYNNYKDIYLKLSNAFNKRNIKIPQYILSKHSSTSGIAKSDIKEYLKHIHYNGAKKKPQIALNRFYRLVRIERIKVPSRF